MRRIVEVDGLFNVEEKLADHPAREWWPVAEGLSEDDARLLAHGRRAVAALEFYADPCSWMWWTAHPETEKTRQALFDKGDKARAALALVRGEAPAKGREGKK